MNKPEVKDIFALLKPIEGPDADLLKECAKVASQQEDSSMAIVSVDVAKEIDTNAQIDESVCDEPTLREQFWLDESVMLDHCADALKDHGDNEMRYLFADLAEAEKAKKSAIRKRQRGDFASALGDEERVTHYHTQAGKYLHGMINKYLDMRRGV